MLLVVRDIYSSILTRVFCSFIGRKRLFNMINELPTVFDVVTGKKPIKEKVNVNNSGGGGGNKTKSAGKMVSCNVSCI